MGRRPGAVVGEQGRERRVERLDAPHEAEFAARAAQRVDLEGLGPRVEVPLEQGRAAAPLHVLEKGVEEPRRVVPRQRATPVGGPAHGRLAVGAGGTQHLEDPRQPRGDRVADEGDAEAPRIAPQERVVAERASVDVVVVFRGEGEGCPVPRRGAAGDGSKVVHEPGRRRLLVSHVHDVARGDAARGPHARVRDAQVALDVLAQPAERGRARELPQARGLRRLIKGRVAPREADAVPEGRVGVCEAAAWPPVVPVDHGRRARELRGREGACGAQRREPRQRGVGRRRVARGRPSRRRTLRRAGVGGRQPRPRGVAALLRQGWHDHDLGERRSDAVDVPHDYEVRRRVLERRPRVERPTSAGQVGNARPDEAVAPQRAPWPLTDVACARAAAPVVPGPRRPRRPLAPEPPP